MATDPIPLNAPAPGEAARPAAAAPKPAKPAKPARRATDTKPWTPFRLQQQPFFEDKHRAFWILQSAGWAGYFILRTLSGMANAMGLSFVVHTALLTGTRRT